MAAVGAVVSTYHYLIEWRPSLEGGACGVGPSCADIWFREFGFVTLAFMALAGFVAILVLVVPRPGLGGTMNARSSTPWSPSSPPSSSPSSPPPSSRVRRVVAARRSLPARRHDAAGDADGGAGAAIDPSDGVVTVEGEALPARAGPATIQPSV